MTSPLSPTKPLTPFSELSTAPQTTTARETLTASSIAPASSSPSSSTPIQIANAGTTSSPSRIRSRYFHTGTSSSPLSYIDLQTQLAGQSQLISKLVEENKQLRETMQALQIQTQKGINDLKQEQKTLLDRVTTLETELKSLQS